MLAQSSEFGGSSNLEYAAGPPVARAIALRALGRDSEALEAALPIAIGPPEIINELRREAFAEAGLAALAVGDEVTIKRLIEFVAELPPALRSPLLRAGAARFAGLLAARGATPRPQTSAWPQPSRELREIEAPFVLAQVLLEHAELLLAAGRDDEAASPLAEAIEIFSRLRATPISNAPRRPERA